MRSDDGKLKGGKLQGHSLAALWDEAKKLLHQVDPDGQRLRYDRGNDQKLIRHENLPNFISLANLRGTVEGIYTFLDCCESMLRDGP